MADLVLRPVFDPATSLGWKKGPIDGLSCLLRCVESILRAQGFDRLQVAQSLAIPLDVVGGRRDPGRYRAGQLRWRNAQDGAEHWDDLVAVVGDGTPVILMPDRYYWPGDEFEGKQHFLDHMVLVIGADADQLTVLDTDAPATDNFVRRIEITPSVVHSACRFATAHFDAPNDTPDSQRATLVEPMVRWLAEDLPAVAAFATRWEREGLTGPLARALHVLVLGELQPHLYLTGQAVRDAFPATADAAELAAAEAQSLGLALLGAHRYAGARASDRSVYRPVIPVFRRVEATLARFTGAACAELGLPGWSTRAGEVDDRMWNRVVRMQAWCFAEGAAAPDADTTKEERER